MSSSGESQPTQGTQDSSSEFGALIFIAQIILVPVIILIFGGIAETMLEGSFGKLINLDVQAYCIFALEGVLLAYTSKKYVPKAAAHGGAWVWLLPASALGLGCAYDVITVPSEIPELFYGVRHHWGIFFYFVTLPTVGSCFYSLGTIVTKTRMATSKRPISTSEAS